MRTYVEDTGRRIMQAALGVPDRLIDLGLRSLAALGVVTLVGFGGYYYLDRYTAAAPPVTDQALRPLEERVVQDPQNPEARVQVAWAYLDQGMYPQAVSQFEAALKLREKYQAALIGLGTAHVRMGDHSKALAAFETVADLNKDNPYKKTLRELQAVYYHLGSIYAADARDEEAIKAFLEALEIDRADADSLYGLGMVFLRQDKLDEARPLLELAIRLDPVFADAYHALKTVYEKQGMVGQALTVRAMLSYTVGKYDEALDLLRQAVRAVPDLPEAHQSLGMVYEKKAQPAEALQAYQVALEKDPQLPLAQSGVARLKR